MQGPPRARPAGRGRDADLLSRHPDVAIAATMFISQSTAKTYMARLYGKLGAGNHAQVLMTAVDHGLIGGEPAPLAFLPVRTARADRQPAGLTS